MTILFTLALMNIAVGDQTSHVYGIHDRTPDKIAFINANIYIEPGKLIKQATLVIENGKVVSVEKKAAAPSDARVIDATGHTIYPGFIDPYSDYIFGSTSSGFNFGEPPKYDGDRFGGNAWNDAIHAQINWYSEFEPDPETAKTYIKNGFTALQTARLDGIFQGQGVVVSLADGIPNDLIYNANAQHFGSFNKGSSKQSYPSSLMGSIALIRQTLSDANWYKEAKGKMSSLPEGKKVEFNAALEALNELATTGLMFNSDDSLSTLRASSLFKPYQLNVSYIADNQEYARLPEIKNTQATFVLPVNFPKQPDVSSFESQLDTSLAELRHWERAPGNAAVLEKNKIEFAFTQYGLEKKSQFWDEVKKTIQHGLSEKAALAALTTVPAKLAGIESKVGRLQPGMMADFVITDGNIFTKGKVKSVYLQGQEQNFEPLSPINVAGTYQLTINNKSIRLTLTQEGETVSGELFASEKSESTSKNNDSKNDKANLKPDDLISLESVSLSGNQLSFHANLTPLGLDGVFRFSLHKSQQQFSGIITFPGFARENISLTLIEPANKSSKDTNETDKKAINYVGKLTFPNRAFGQIKSPKQVSLHIKNATVWTSEKAGILVNTDILIRNGEITQIGKSLSTPSGYQVIDATGKHVTAGIIDEHSHIAISKGVNEGSDAITAEVRIGDVVNPDDINIYRALAGGTTAAQLLHGSANPIGGQAQVIKLRWGANAEELKFKQAPPSIKFALGENVKQSNWGDQFTIRYPQTRMGVDTIVRDAFLRAREYKQSFDVYDDLSRSQQKQTAPPRVDYRKEALDEIMANKRFVHAHSYVASEILNLMQIAEDFGFKIQTFTHILEGYKVADEMAKHGASASTFADWWAYKFEVYDAIPGNTCLMMKNGVNVSVNSDSGDLIRRLNTEAAKSINYCGMTPEDAIKMVTINPAKQLKVDKYTGSIKAGKDADFVIWSGNPLSIYSKVEQTWIEGRRYFDIEEDEKMRIQLSTEKSQLIQKALSSDNASSTAKNGHSESRSANDSELQRYLLKDNTVWHCEDNFDFWHFINNKTSTKQSVQQGGH